MKFQYPFLLALLLSVLGFASYRYMVMQDKNYSEVSDQLCNLQDKLQDELVDLKCKLKRRIMDLKFKMLRSRVPYKLRFNFKDSNCWKLQKIRSSSGNIFDVAVADLQPYFNGVKFILKMGNNSPSMFESPTINIRWNKRYEGFYHLDKEKRKAARLLWKKGFKHKEVAVPRLCTGSTSIEVLLFPCTMDELEHVEITTCTPSVTYSFLRSL